MAGLSDIFLITQTKVDNTFPVSQFHIDGFSTLFKLDKNMNWSDIIVYVSEISLAIFRRKKLQRRY